MRIHMIARQIKDIVLDIIYTYAIVKSDTLE